MADENDGRTFEELYAQGSQLLHRNEAKQAVELLKKAYELGPDHVDAAINLGGAYILSGRFRSAAKVLEGAVGVDPENPIAWTNLGAAYLGNPVLARDDEQLKAIAAFTRALELRPASPSVAYNIGLIYRDRMEWKEAEYWFREAIKTNPKDRDAISLFEKMIAIQRESE
ncbi:MAG: tetratricopeptide repeat protein [Candidatus Promineifilaceae bacterium]